MGGHEGLVLCLSPEQSDMSATARGPLWKGEEAERLVSCCPQRQATALRGSPCCAPRSGPGFLGSLPISSQKDRLPHLCPSSQLRLRGLLLMKNCLDRNRGLLPTSSELVYASCHVAGRLSSASCFRLPLGPVGESSHSLLPSSRPPPPLPTSASCPSDFIDR